MSLDVVPPVEIDGGLVSSSRVRQLIAAGDWRRQPLLSQPYRIRGIVTHGAGRGAKIGFPTANLAGIDTLLPAAGCYAGRAWVSGERWPAAINLGTSPTFGDPIVARRSSPDRAETNPSTASRWRLTSWPACGTFGHSPRSTPLSSNCESDVAQAKQLAAT